MHHVASHTAQRKPCKVEAEELDFLEYIRPRLIGNHRSPHYIMNMDQTPVYHAMCSGKTIDQNTDLSKLSQEEFNEFKKALLDEDNVEQLDACMDMIWVILGYCIMKGYDVKGAWDEVARSNLSKIDKVTGKVIKRADGKVLKPEGWTPPQLEKYLANPTK